MPPTSISEWKLEMFLLHLDGSLSIAGYTPALALSLPVPVYTSSGEEKGKARVQCLANEPNTIILTRARTRTAES